MSELHTFFDDAFEFVDADADLLHGVAVAQGDGVVFQSLEVDGDAARRADFVLTAVAAADGAGVVVEAVPATVEFFENFARFADQFVFVFEQREDGDFVRRDARREAQNGAGLPAPF